VRVPIVQPLNAPIQQASASLWLEARPHFGEISSATVSMSLDAMDSSVEPEPLRARVREAYVAVFKDGWEARLGQQIVPWGNADIWNPTDFLSARDYGFFAVDSEARRLGNLDLWASWTPAGGESPWQLTVVWAPVLEGSTLLIPAGLIPAGVTVTPTVSPSYTLDNSEVAARVAFRGSGWDAALVGFRGFNHDPEYIEQSASTQAVVVAQTYRHILAAGGEASVSPGKWVLRAEGAYVATENAIDGNHAVQPSHIDAIVGVERPFGDRLRVNLQGFMRYYPSFDVGPPAGADPVTAAVQGQIITVNELLQNFQHPWNPGGTLRLTWTSPGGTLELEGVVVVNFASAFDSWNCIARPLVTYHATDALRFSLGAEYFGGARDTPLGALRDFSGGFLGGDYRF
jgi:hypothetical protein